MRVLPYGPWAMLVEFDDLDEVIAASTAWRAASLPGVVDIVPAERTVLVEHDGPLDPAALAAPRRPVGSTPRRHGGGNVIEIPVTYDGVDLEEVADAVGLSPAQVVALHTSAVHRVAFCGFMPGFAYLVDGPTELSLPRRATPRERVPPGSVAVAAGYSGVYPRESPGGWHLLGRTDVVLWDEARPVPALLTPGTSVRFVAR
ncbi:MAG: 5-oxoprolinase subunit B family protein [Ilumatobacteraceae bacterium]